MRHCSLIETLQHCTASRSRWGLVKQAHHLARERLPGQLLGPRPGAADDAAAEEPEPAKKPGSGDAVKPEKEE